MFAPLLKGSPDRRKSRLPPAFVHFELWTVLFFALSMLFHLVERHRHITSLASYPLSTRDERFNDFRFFAYKFEFYHRPGFFKVGFPINYPAPCILFFEFFFRFFHHFTIAFVAFSVAALIATAALFARSLWKRGIGVANAAQFSCVLTLLSWPAVLLIDRGNVEILVFITIAAAFWALGTGRSWWAAALFGVGASLKLFPFVFIGLFVSLRQWGKALFATVTFLAVSLVSLAVVGPTISDAYRGIAFGLNSFKANYMALWRPSEDGVDHSIFALYKTIAVTFFHHSSSFANALTVYLALSVGAGVLLYAFRIRLLPLLNQALLLTIASIYFTAFSGDGTLIHLYAPLAMILYLALRAAREGVAIPGLRLILSCLVFILSFETFFVFHDQRYIGPAKSIALGVLFVAALIFPLGPSLHANSSSTILADPDLAWLGGQETAPRLR